MRPRITQRTVQEFANDVSDQHYAMAGTVIATSAANAAALGEACMQISFDNQVDILDWQDATSRIEQMLHIKNMLLEWADQDAQAIAAHHKTQTGRIATPQLYEGPAEMARLSITAIKLLQDFRPLAFGIFGDNLEMAVSLLRGAAQAALRLLESNINQEPDSSFANEYRPVFNKLVSQIEQSVVVP